MDQKQEPGFRLTLKSVPGCSIPAELRLKRVLKSLIRIYGFRATAVELVSTEPKGKEK